MDLNVDSQMSNIDPLYVYRLPTLFQISESTSWWPDDGFIAPQKQIFKQIDLI